MSSPALSPDGATVFVGSWDDKLYAIQATTQFNQFCSTDGQSQCPDPSPVTSPCAAGTPNDIIATDINSCSFKISSDGALSRLGDCSSLEYLSLSNKCIKSLAPGLFDDMSKVSRIFLDGNQLETLPGHLFHSNTALVRIRLSNNHLRTLPADLFEKNVDLW